MSTGDSALPQVPRYCPQRPLPPYSYVPGLAPHPMSDPRGHSFGQHEPAPPPLESAAFQKNAAYGFAIDLFNHGYYWEAHEAWESLWHAAGRRGPAADFLKGLIKLAAAGVKAREGRAAGVKQHALRAAELLRLAAASPLNEQGWVFGLWIDDLIAAAVELAASAESLAGDGRPAAARTLPLIIYLEAPSKSA